MEGPPKRDKIPLLPFEGEPFWHPRLEPAKELDVFEFEYRAAELWAKHIGVPTIDVVRDKTNDLRWAAFYVGFDFRTGKYRPGINTSDLVASAYKSYRAMHAEDTILEPYHAPDTAAFGCMKYELREAEGSIGIHFDNAERAVEGPFSPEGIERRKLEMHDLLAAVKQRHPDIEVVMGNSWLYHIPGYRSLFPESYVENLHPDLSEDELKRGSTVWGQFIDRNNRLKRAEADAFLKALEELPPGAPFSDVYAPKGPVLPPMRAEAPISDFYEHYGIV